MSVILDAAAELVAEHPSRARPGAGWPCCEWVGRISLRAARTVSGLAGPPPGWWAAMCIYDASRPWSPIEAGRQLVELATGFEADAPGRVVTPALGRPTSRFVDAVLDGLVAGRCHILQRWTYLQPDGTARGQKDGGHTVFMWYLGAGVGLICESSEERGVRLGGQPWTGAKPEVEPRSVVEWLAAARGGVATVPLWEGA